MKLTVFNGSPRGKKSNTKILVDHFSQGFKDSGNNGEHKIKTAYLIHQNEIDDQLKMYKNARQVIIAFPLCTDAMPGLVMNFIEKLAAFCENKKNPRMGFLVQSGFPEAHHSRYVEKYLIGLAERMGSPYLGTIIKSSVEGIQVKPPFMTKKLFKLFY